MSYRLKLGLTVAIGVFATLYFGWRYFGAEGEGNLVYLAMIIVGWVFIHRAINDIKAEHAAKDDETSSTRAGE